MLRALVPFIVGIVLADGIAPPVWGVAIGFVVCTVAAIALQKRAHADIYIVVALILAGLLEMEIREVACTTPDHQSTMEIVIDNITSQRQRATMADAHLAAYTTDEGRKKSRAEIRVTAEPQLAIKAGDRLLVTGRINDFEEDYYGRYMLSRGVAGQVFVSSRNVQLHLRGNESWAMRLRAWAVERVRRLQLESDNEAVVLAMSVGERSGITPSLRQAYSRGGAAHLLAVSGLHVGYICVMANLLLAWLVVLRHGQTIRSVAVIVLIWLFAAMAGFTPSIVRAAVMFSILQMAIQTSTRTNTINTLCFTAFAMLAWDARMLYDAGFQLSFIAVAAIIEWGVPLFPQRRRGVMAWCWQWLVSGIVTSFVAAIATLPLTAYLFGSISLWSVVTGTVMVALAGVVVGATMVWIMLPIGVAQGVAGQIINGISGVMNGVAEWCDNVGILAAEVRIEGWMCATIYAIMAAVTIIVWAARGKN